MRYLHVRLLELRHAEQGIALPAALLVTVISFALATAAVFASVESQRGTERDSGSKDAIAAADAGANVAMLRLNEFANDLNSSTPCLGLSAGTLVTTTATEGWCPEITGTVGGATYSYRMSSASGTTTNIVASGTADGVSRRVDITLKHDTVGSIFGEAGMIGQEKITLEGNSDIRVGLGTNGNLETSGNTEICNNIRHGVGKEWKHSGNVTQCSGYKVTEGNTSLPAVSSFMPANIETENSDSRLVYCTKTSPVKEPTGCESDSYSGGTWSSTSPWNPTTRSLSASGNTVITLGGGNYWLCSLKLEGNSEFIMAQGAKVRLFFDTPEHCGLSSGSAQISIGGNDRISATGYQPSLGEYETPGFYLMGSATIPTTVDIAGNSSTDEFVIYGPNTNIEITGNATYKGVVAGKTVKDTGNGAFEDDSGFEPPEIGGSTLYARQAYVECEGGAPTSPANKSC